MDELLLHIAKAQHGLLTTSQATACGVDDSELATLTRLGELRHLARGLYALRTPEPLTPQQAHLELARGGLLLYPDASLSHDAAALAHGLPLFHGPPSHVDLVRPVPRQVRTQRFVIHPGDEVSPAATAYGPAVPAAVAVMQLARARGVTSGVVAADAGLHSRLVTPADLQAEVGRLQGWPRSHRVAMVADLADGRIESVGESRTRLICLAGGLALEPQVVVRDAHRRQIGRVDFRVEGTRVLLEFDGKVKYATGDGDVLFREKLREDDLRRLGYVVVRIVWADLGRPGELLARVRQAVLLDARRSGQTG